MTVRFVAGWRHDTGIRLTYLSDIRMMDIWSAKARTVITEYMKLSISLNSSTLV